jgi:hypothetical protein
VIERYLVVAARIRQELMDLEEAIARAERAVAACGQHPEDKDLYLDSAALNLHDFYGGLERVFHHMYTASSSILSESTIWYSARGLALNRCGVKSRRSLTFSIGWPKTTDH